MRALAGRLIALGKANEILLGGAAESARLEALKIRQQLGTQALGIANQTPQGLLSLFRG